VALNQLNGIVNEVLGEYVEGPEYDGGQTSDDELRLPGQPEKDT
jgi:hypothetical protein